MSEVEKMFDEHGRPRQDLLAEAERQDAMMFGRPAFARPPAPCPEGCILPRGHIHGPDPVTPDRVVDFVEVSDIPRLIAEALDAADKRREERSMRQLATQNLEGLRQRFVGQLEALDRACGDSPEERPVLLELANQTRELIDEIDDKLAVSIAANADMVRESIRQARASIEERPAVEIMQGAKLIKNHGKRR